MNDLLRTLPPQLRQAILSKLNDVKADEEISDDDVRKIAEDVVKSEVEKEGGSQKLNMGKILTSMEQGIYFKADKSLEANILEAKGISDAAYISPFNVEFYLQLKSLGIIGVENGALVTDENGVPIIIDKEAASKIAGKEVNDFVELYRALRANSYSLADDIEQNLSEEFLEYFIGPLNEFATEEDYDNDNITGKRYVLNMIKIEEDFAEYLAQPGNKIETIEELMNALDWKNNNTHGMDGQINEDVKQGGNGDCWIISSVLALNSTEAGKQIIKNSMQVHSNGSVTITFNGVKDNDGNPVSYTITRDEILAHDTDYNTEDRYSNGDNDMLAMELAVEKLEKDIYTGKYMIPIRSAVGADIMDANGQVVGRDYIQGGSLDRVMFFLSGVQSQTYEADESLLVERDGVGLSGLPYEQVEELLNKAAEGNVALTFGMYPDPDNILEYIDENGAIYYTARYDIDENGKKFILPIPIENLKLDYNKPMLDGNGEQIYDEAGNPQYYPLKDENGNFVFDENKSPIGHALVITNVDKENQTVTFVNPWDSTDEYTFTWDQFQQLGIFTMSATDLNGVSVEKSGTKGEEGTTVSGSETIDMSDNESAKVKTEIDNLSINGEFSLDQIQQFVGNNSSLWSYLTVIPPKDGGTEPTFKVNLDAIKSRFPHVRTMGELRDAVLNKTDRAGTRDSSTTLREKPAIRGNDPYDRATDEVAKPSTREDRRQHLFIREY